MIFKGLGVAVITPFTKSLDIDFVAFNKIITNLIENGADYLVLMGTTAESPTLNKQEKRQLIDAAIEINQARIPIVVGIGGNNTIEVAKDFKTFDFAGVSGILSVSPYYNKPSQQGIYNHYKILAEATDVPIIMYNVPGRTSSNMTAETSLRLAHDFQNIVAVKEASGDLEQIMQIIKNKPTDFMVISGDDLLALPQMAIGMDGVISVIGNAFPFEFSNMLKLASSNINDARLIHYKLQELIRLIFEEGNPVGIKVLLNQMNYCDIHVRPPVYKASDQLIEKIKKELSLFNA
ncbi:MAG: 4-hydroxy-tetrahydrodipicolinate synthase [Bacteroidetes bacterium]|jgi:4-hydroxy-tetrahydrodipicolinate synthase|nr:4-hydroxy-tetrahydrodipicolinate synthase [Bacteroidota bacterium]MBT7828597.1 4-hydroxy-tetrahydrodipicolinate synthase [Bacteroidota bacterium]